MAVLIACLDTLWNEFDTLAPDRDTASDGWIGDAAHADRTSDHNPDESGSVPIHDADTIDEVHAIDVDDQLRSDDATMEECVQFLLARCRSGAERRLRYIIYERRIWEAANDWRQESYTGSNPHDQHAHFSASYETAHESSTAPWGLLGEFSMTPAEVEQACEKALNDFFWERTQDDGTPTSRVGHLVSIQGIPDGTAEGTPRAYWYAAERNAAMVLIELQDAVHELSRQVADLQARVGQST